MNPDATLHAGADLASYLVKAYRTERGVHAETVIGAAAALAGEFALRATKPDLPDRGFVNSPKTSTLLFGTDPLGSDGLCIIIRQGAAKAGADADQIPAIEDVAARVSAAVDTEPYPPLSVPENHLPQEWSPNACPRLRLGVAQICREHDLSRRQAATALVVAVAFLINETREVLDPAISARLALETLVAVSRMAPLGEEVERGPTG